MDSGGGVQPKREGISPKAIIAIVIAVVVLIFAFQNADETNVSVLSWDLNVPLWFVIAATAGLGFVVGWLLGRASGRRRAIARLSD